MALGEASEVNGSNIFNAPFIHFARRNVAGLDQVAQPLGGEGVYLVVVGSHRRFELTERVTTSQWSTFPQDVQKQ